MLKGAREFVLRPEERLLRHRPGTLLAALVRGRETVKEGFEREFRPLMMTSTTGRAAEPAPFFYTAHDIRTLSVAGARVMRICGARREMRMLNMFPFAPHLAFWQTHYAGTEFGVFMISSGGGKTLGTEGNLRLIRKIEPDVLIGMPTFLYHVLRAAVDEGCVARSLEDRPGRRESAHGNAAPVAGAGARAGRGESRRVADLRIYRSENGVATMRLRRDARRTAATI